MAVLDDLMKTLRRNKTKAYVPQNESLWDEDPYAAGTDIPAISGPPAVPGGGEELPPETTMFPTADQSVSSISKSLTMPEEGDPPGRGGGYEQPPLPPERTYDYLTAEQFFTEMYNIPENVSYIEPFLQEGGNWDNLATQYAGLPVVSGYWTGEGENRIFHPEQSLYNQASQLLELKNTDYPAFQEWLATTGGAYTQDITQTAPYAGITDIAADFNDLTDEMQRAWNAAAKANGFVTETGEGDGAAYSAYIESQRQQKDLGVMGQTGVMGTEYETAARRATQASIDQTVEANMQMIESLGMKSSAAAFSKMNEISNTIQNMTLQADVKLLEQDILMRQLEYEALLKRSEQAADTGLAAGSQYLEMLVNNRMLALESYATQLDTVLKNNAQTLQQYGLELERITMHADTTYKSIMAQIGYEESQMQLTEDRYNQYMQPYYDKMEAWYQRMLVMQGAEANAIARMEAEGGGFFDLLFDGLLIFFGAMFGGPAGAAGAVAVTHPMDVGV